MAFEAELTKALVSLNPAGIFQEQVETEVVIAAKRAGTVRNVARLKPIFV
jgi:hypothetical protein